SRGNEQTGENQRHSAAPLGAKNFHSAALKKMFSGGILTPLYPKTVVPAGLVSYFFIQRHQKNARERILSFIFQRTGDVVNPIPGTDTP
ncbi:MAG: hypothetical protein JXA71_20330, partial [Chitinispirillaceae bacterium]|nr:hypothetical protein [Chitinispirillaceae bacterium]